MGEHLMGSRQCPKHLRKAWNQWQITKYPVNVSSDNDMDAAVQTHKDYQEDMNFLFTSQTVSKGTVSLWWFVTQLSWRYSKLMTQRNWMMLPTHHTPRIRTLKQWNILKNNVLMMLANWDITFYDMTATLTNVAISFGVMDPFNTLWICYLNLTLHKLTHIGTNVMKGKDSSDALGLLLKQKTCAAVLCNIMLGNYKENIQIL